MVKHGKKVTAPIIVLGTGRSGTSILAGMLHYLGVNMGEEFAPADQNNIGGHWEDAEVTNLVRKALAREIDEEAFKDGMREISVKRTMQGGLWGWKLPATANVLPLIQSMPEFANARYIRSDRPRDEFIESCVRCYADQDMTPERAAKMWDIRVDVMDRLINDNDSITLAQTTHSSIVDNPDQTIDTLVNFLDLNPSPEQVTLARSMVDTDTPYRDPNTKLMIAVPTMGDITTDLVGRLLLWQGEFKNRITFYMPTNFTPVDAARNDIVREFLAGDYTHLWQIDADTIPPTWALRSLLSADVDIITGATPAMRRNTEGEWSPALMTMKKVERDGKVVHLSYRGHGIESIERTGGSCLMLKRHVVEDMLARGPLFVTLMEPDYLKKKVGEDIYFSDRAIAEGYKIYANYNVICRHAKTVQL